MKKNKRVMSSPKGSKMVNVVPTKSNVDETRIYLFTDSKVVKSTFKMYEDNRTLNKTHIAEIASDIMKEPYKARFIAPVRIDINTMGIADGQHRVSAFLKAWEAGSTEEMKVIFENYPTDPNGRMSVIARMNGTNKNWGVNDHQHRLLVENNIHMINIESFGKSHTLCQKKNKKGEVIDFFPRYAYAILLGKNATKDVKDGSIKISKSDLDFGEQIHTELEQLVTALGYEVNSWFESFAHAWYNIRRNDKANSALIDELGLENICKNIRNYFHGWQVVTRKTEWENRFRTAIWEVKRETLK